MRSSLITLGRDSSKRVRDESRMTQTAKFETCPATRGTVLPLAAAILLLSMGAAQAQDKVILQRSSYLARVTVSGVVENYTGTEISIRTENGEPVKTFPAADVVEIQTVQVESHTRGLQLLAEGDVEQALRELEVAVKKEPRTWVRREILAALVRAGLRRGDYVGAGTRFLAMIKSDPTTRQFRVIPLVWAPETIARETRSEALAWMQGKVEAGRLMGASLLYDDRVEGKEARSVLKELSSNTDDRVRVLAQMQARREESLAGSPGRLQTAQWQQRIDEMPEDLRAGPYYLLGRVYAGRHDYELAAATLLWLPLVDDHDFRLAARACLEAGAALDRIGQHAEARTLYREVTVRFADTPFASEAADLLQRGEQSLETSAGKNSEKSERGK
jgi:tetratricopeptide (TPR) repeat protein